MLQIPTGDLKSTMIQAADLIAKRGIKEGLGIRSKIGVPIEIGGERRGVVMIASLKADCFSEDDVIAAETLVRWAGLLAQRAELAEEMRRNSICVNSEHWWPIFWMSRDSITGYFASIPNSSTSWG